MTSHRMAVTWCLCRAAITVLCLVAISSHGQKPRIIRASSSIVPRVYISASAAWYVDTHEKVSAVCLDEHNVTVTWYFAEIGEVRKNWKDTLHFKGLPSVMSIRLRRHLMPLHLLNPMKLQTMHLVAIVTRLGESRPLFSAVLPIRVSLTTHDMFVTTNRMVYERGDTGIVSAIVISKDKKVYQTPVSCDVKVRTGAGVESRFLWLKYNVSSVMWYSEERGQTDSLVTLKGMSADAAGWRQVPLNTNDLPKNLNHFVVSCEERYQRTRPSVAVFSVISRADSDYTYPNDLRGSRDTVVLTATRSQVSLQSWLRSVQARYSTGQPLHKGRLQISVPGGKFNVILNLDGKVPAEEIVPVSTEIKIAQDGFPAGHRLYLVARDTLSKSTAKLLVPQRLPLEELCVPRSLTISPARYIKQEQMSVKICAGNCAHPISMSPVLTLTAFYGDSGQAQNTDEQTITATGLRKKGDCFTARVSSGQAQRLTVRVPDVWRLLPEEALLITEDSPLVIHFGESNCSASMTADTCTLWLLSSKRQLSVYLNYEVSSGPFLLWSSGGPVSLDSSDQFPLTIPGRHQIRNNLTVIVRIWDGKRRLTSAQTHVIVSSSQAEKAMVAPTLAAEFEGFPSSSVKVTTIADPKSFVHLMVWPANSTRVAQPSYKYSIDLKNQIFRLRNTFFCPQDAVDCPSLAEGGSSMEASYSSWDVPANLPSSQWPPVKAKIGSSGILVQSLTFPIVFGEFFLQAIVVSASGHASVTNMVQVHGRLPGRQQVTSRVVVPHSLRGGIAATVSCIWKVKDVKLLIGVKAVSNLILDGIPAEINQIRGPQSFSFAKRLQIDYTVTTARGGAGAFRCALTAAGFTWRSSDEKVTIKPKCVPLQCGIETFGPCATLTFPNTECKGFCSKFVFVPRPEEEQPPLNHTYTAVHVSPITMSTDAVMEIQKQRDHGEEWKYSARPSNSTHAETVFVNSRIVRVSVENEILKERFASIFSTTCDSFGPQTRFNILIEPVLYPDPGNWGEWSSYSRCNTICGNGMRTRRRKCDNPPPIHGGRECPGSSEEHKVCAMARCKALSREQPSCGQLPGNWPSLNAPEQNRHALAHSWPWMAVITNNGLPHCPASVLCSQSHPDHIKYVLTTASCMRGVEVDGSNSQLAVEIGRYNLNSAEESFLTCDVVKKSTHLQYMPSTDDNNIEILSIRCPMGRHVQDQSARCVCLPSEEDALSLSSEGSVLRMAGWGPGILSSNREEDIPLVERQLKVDKAVLCSDPSARMCVVEEFQGGCPMQAGDDGNPIVLYRASEGQVRPVVQIGIATGQVCNSFRPASPIVDISEYTEWIRQHTRG